ncbi:DUF1365 domain-containing protein [Janthinobacterium sp. Mn2066]|uniref:DUF1365 domain-containing protein n=1 Tax=Janthinobacterium sp. Mn2066 TaxID=3395264 RepID=UPI003BC7D95D
MPRDPSLPVTAQPQLCLGQVRHTRLRPRRHFFSYGIYYLRLPLRSMGNVDFDARLISRNGANLLSFRDSDHGDGATPLLDWIDGLLQEHDVTDADGEIWLQTMPRVFGYVFNPVSFWFCHRADGALRAVLCDVRNTFGERHLYLLDHGAAIAYGSELRANKIFHVSPFCKVEGNYRFRFLRSKHGAGQGERHLACVDYDDASGPLLQTSLSGIAVPLRDGALGRALLRYPLMTFGVMARIHWQALRLWLRRVPFFSKPHPPQEKLSR